MLLRPFEPTDTESVVALWADCGLIRPWNDPRKDIERKVTEQPELFLVGVVDGAVSASAMFGFDGTRGWVHYLAVHPSRQGHGAGRLLMEEGERMLAARGCPKLNLQVRTDNTDVLGFYASIGYERDDVVSLGKRLIPDQA